MGYFDYSRPDVPDFSEGIRHFGDALSEVVRRRQQQKQFDERMRFEREDAQRKFAQNQANINYQNRLADLKERRDRMDFNMRQDTHNAAIMDRARKAASPQEAEAILATAKRYDPGTGDLLGSGSLKAGEVETVGTPPVKPVEPAMPPEIAARFRGKQRPQAPTPEAGALVGPIPSAEEARRAEIMTIAQEPATEEVPDVEGRIRAREDMRQGDVVARDAFQRKFEAYREEANPEMGPTAADAAYDKARKQYESELKSYPARFTAHEAAQRGAEARRPYTMSVPGQPDVTFDFQTQRYAGADQAAERFLASLPDNMSPTQQQAARKAHSAIRSGADPNKVQVQFAQRLRLGVEQDFKHGEGMLRDQNRLDVQELRNKKPGANISIQRFGFDERKERSKNLRQDLADWTKKFDAKTIQDDHLSTPRIIENLESGNPQRQRNAMIELWRMAQHDNRMSDRDAIMAQTVDPSWLAVIENAVSQKTEGTLDEGVRKTAVATARGFAKALSDKMAAMKSNARAEFIDSGLYDQHEADVLLGQKLPGWERLTQNPGGPPEVNAKTKGKNKKALSSPLDEAMQ
jgi:hypothetical protein